ncbi:hypothetical protein NEIELOOT_00640 [Neisseria elongata subsp. glycolytica ATCC 29315]|uniref:Uncharacterized protein n=1 Tax=Neisseria elongata subsp. glycolytica ATCC 29315 TaxID=546263 RepID=D4DNK7_NEIEG|nr:hypothetical protein NEIELOOT_00640 [Neisseria elongata subsp. glycolytica ATCC 29315]
MNCIRHFLHQLDYPGKDVKAIGKVDNKIVLVPDTRYKEKISTWVTIKGVD